MDRDDTGRSGRTKVLLTTASVGAGHNSAARAIKAALAERAPEIDVEYLDVLDFTPWAFRVYYAGGYARMVSRHPLLYGLAYHLTDRPHRPGRALLEWRRLTTERLAMRRLADHVVRANADLIVNTHFLAPPLIAHLIRRGCLNARQMTVITDIAVHRYWYAEQVERWFVPADAGVACLLQWGIQQERITVSGIPVHPKWTRPISRQEVLSRWNLPADKRIILLSGGTEFTCAPVTRIARDIASRCPQACVAVLCGNNKKLLARVAKLSRTQNAVVGVSYTDRLHELLGVCSLMITKAGGITTAECLAKAVPMLLLKPIPGQEAGNAAYFERQGAAVIVRRTADVALQTSSLLRDDRTLANLADNARRLYRNGSGAIVNEICRAVSSAYVRQEQPSDRSAAPPADVLRATRS